MPTPHESKEADVAMFLIMLAGIGLDKTSQNGARLVETGAGSFLPGLPGGPCLEIA